ncbi:FtsX-like permease family protein [Anaerolineae bacterium CFX7]|nr:FtsX-like permease family protein [Anaerolineae bacterium CFX7]
MSLALRNLFQDKTRFALSVGGVALAVMLTLLLNGFLAGMYAQITAYLENAPGSIVIAQDGVNNLLGATSLLPAGAAVAVKSEGAENVVPILSQFIILELHEKKQPAYLIGYEPKIGGGPWRMAAGREPRNEREVVFDRILAQRHDIALGETIEIMDRDFTVVGLSDGTSSWMTSFIFVRKVAAENLLRAPDASSFLLVTPPARFNDAAMLARLRNVARVQVLPKQQVMANDMKLFGKFFSAPIQLMVAIAFLVGTLIVGLVIYTATVERQREYGVLKAIGAKNGMLYRVVAAQAVIAAGAGSLIGIAATYGAAQLIMSVYPQFLVVVEPRALIQSLVIGLGMALLAALFPARVIARLAPAEVFRK